MSSGICQRSLLAVSAYSEGMFVHFLNERDCIEHPS